VPTRRLHSQFKAVKESQLRIQRASRSEDNALDDSHPQDYQGQTNRKQQCNRRPRLSLTCLRCSFRDNALFFFSHGDPDCRSSSRAGQDGSRSLPGRDQRRSSSGGCPHSARADPLAHVRGSFGLPGLLEKSVSRRSWWLSACFFAKSACLFNKSLFESPSLFESFSSYDHLQPPFSGRLHQPQCTVLNVCCVQRQRMSHMLDQPLVPASGSRQKGTSHNGS
jgi:hypothetical protein